MTTVEMTNVNQVKVNVDFSIPKPDPADQAQWKLDMEESILYEREAYMYNPPNCSECVYMNICCWKIWAKYEAKGGRKMVYYNNCTCGPPCLIGHWHVKYLDGADKQDLGYSTGMNAGQGCKSCCCPCGEKIIQNFYDSKGKRQYTIRKKVTCTNCFCTTCAPLGVCVAQCIDGISWCSNDNYIVLKEQLMDADGKTSVGEISQLIRVDCELCCCPIRTPIRYSVNMKDPSSHSPVLVSILPMFYRGIPAPCQCCHAAPATPLTGVQMIDSGRKFTMTRGNFQTILSSAGQPEDMEMQR